MRSLRLTSVFGLALVLGGGAIGCGSDSSGAPPAVDAPVDSVKRDGAVDHPSVTVDAAASDDAAEADGGVVSSDAGVADGDSDAVATDASDDATPTVAVDADSDAVVVVPPIPDASVGDTGPAVSVTSCAMATACANFFATATACKPANPCTIKHTGSGDTELKNYCFDNGVKEFWAASSPSDTTYRETTTVQKADHSVCYTKIADGKDTPNNAPETWTFKAADGITVIATAISGDKLTVTCGGVTYDDLGGLNCPGLADLPSDATCTAGTCTQ